MRTPIRIPHSRALIIAITILLGAALRAQAPAPPDPFTGTWKLDSKRSTFEPGPPPKSMTVTFISTVDSATANIDIVLADGTPGKWSYIVKLDEKDYPVNGHPDADIVSAKRVDPRTIESTFKKAGRVTAVDTRTVSPDGKVMTVTSTGTTVQGQRITNVQVFKKH
jgi:hypothetical protein